MATKKKYPEIKRTGGPFPTNRFGVVFSTLSRSQKRLLIENPLLRDRCQSDQFVHILFEQLSYKIRGYANQNKLFYDWSTGDIVQRENLVESYNTIEWTCALSGMPIRAKMGEFNLENFVHPKFHEALKSAPMVDSRILKSSVEFRKKCKELLLNQQEEFLKLVKRGKDLS